MKNLLAFVTLLIGGNLTVKEFRNQVLAIASVMRDRAQGDNRSKMETFIRKFTEDEAKSVAQMVEQFSGGIVRFKSEPTVKAFYIRATKVETVNKTIPASNPEEALEIARKEFGPGYALSIS